MMAHHFVSPADKLAREILKAATQGLIEQSFTLALIESWFAYEAPDPMRAAVGYAIRAGWLTARDGGWRLTAIGSEIGRRSLPA